MAQRQEEVARIRREFIQHAIGVLLSLCAFWTIGNLQSSINIEDGLGTFSVAAYFGVSVISGIFVTPVLLRIFGAKKCVVASDVAFMFYILANLYPTFYTLLPAAIFVGMSEATIWPCLSVINFYYAMEYFKLCENAKKDKEHYVGLFTGAFYSISEFNQIFGNLISYLILFAFTKTPVSPLPEAAGNSTNYTNYAANYTEMNRYHFCGANDCQDEDVVDDSLDQYSPASWTSIYILIGCLVAMSLAAQLMHGFLLPDIRSDATLLEDQSPGFTSASTKRGSELDVVGDSEDKENVKCAGDDSSLEMDGKGSATYKRLISKTLKQIGGMMLTQKHLLIFPLTLYEGLMYGYVYGDLSRAFSSCVLGYAHIGISFVIYGFCHSVTSFLVGRYGDKIGRIGLVLAAASLDIANYLFGLLWEPNWGSSWSIYLMFLSFGISDGIWMTVINVTYLSYFPEKKDIASTMWNLWLNVGLTIQYAWSTSLCVYVKIYVQLATLALGILCYVIAEMKYSKASNFFVEERRNYQPET